MRKLILFTLVTLSLTSFGQRKIVGRILDSETSRPIKNVKIQIQESTVESTTNQLGLFEIEIAETARKLTVTHISYGAAEITLPEQDRFMFTLTKMINEIPEINISNFREELKYEIKPDSSKQQNDLTESARFEGGNESLFNYLGEKIVIEDSIKDKILNNNVEVLFTVEKDGSVNNVIITGDTLFGMGNRINSTIATMPKWKPASQKGEVCDQDFKVKITYGDPVFLMIDSPASFPGSRSGDPTFFIKYVHQNIVYPEEAKKNRIQGTVFVQFIVNKTGEIIQDQIKILKGLGHGLDEEVIRVVKNSPKWSPASQRGFIVYQRMVIPIRVGK